MNDKKETSNPMFGIGSNYSMNNQEQKKEPLFNKKEPFFEPKINEAAIVLKGVCRHFKQGRETLNVLRGLDLTVKSGEIVSLIGPSGAGKSTLLHIAGLLEKPSDGEIIIGDKSCANLNDKLRTKIRREYLGFVYQHHNLLPEFTALENVVLPQMIAGVKKKQAKIVALELLERMGLANRVKHLPSELSGGEQQRVAIARALANEPKLLLADEPTGNLDPNTAQIVFDELLKLVREKGLAALIATHNPELAARMDRKVALRDGKLIELEHFFVGRRGSF